MQEYNGVGVLCAAGEEQGGSPADPAVASTIHPVHVGHVWSTAGLYPL